MTTRRIVSVSIAALALAASALMTVPAQAAETTALDHGRIVGLRVEEHDHFDRVIFDVEGALPEEVSVEYVDVLEEDATGNPVPVPGRAILRVRMFSIDAHDDEGAPTVTRRRAFALPNVMVAVNAGDFEGVVTYGLGLAEARRARIYTAYNPRRVVVDVNSEFPRIPAKVWFLNQPNYEIGEKPYMTVVKRRVSAVAPAAAVMDRLLAGPTIYERDRGLRLVRSGVDAWSNLSISDGIARVRVRGNCSSGGSTFTIANEIMPALKQFASVSWVKIAGPGGQTAAPTGPVDSIPTCLEP